MSAPGPGKQARWHLLSARACPHAEGGVQLPRHCAATHTWPLLKVARQRLITPRRLARSVSRTSTYIPPSPPPRRLLSFLPFSFLRYPGPLPAPPHHPSALHEQPPFPIVTRPHTQHRNGPAIAGRGPSLDMVHRLLPSPRPRRRSDDGADSPR